MDGNLYIFLQDYAFEDVIREMTAIWYFYKLVLIDVKYDFICYIFVQYGHTEDVQMGTREILRARSVHKSLRLQLRCVVVNKTRTKINSRCSAHRFNVISTIEWFTSSRCKQWSRLYTFPVELTTCLDWIGRAPMWFNIWLEPVSRSFVGIANIKMQISFSVNLLLTFEMDLRHNVVIKIEFHDYFIRRCSVYFHPNIR